MQDILVTSNGRQANIRRADGVEIAAACGDNGQSLSSAELLAAALGSCVAANLMPLFERHALNPAALQIALRPQSNGLEAGFNIQVRVPSCSADILTRLQRGAERCAVRQSLNIPVTFHWQVD